MCYGMGCRYEHAFTGECRGPRDWSQPDAVCQEKDEEIVTSKEFSENSNIEAQENSEN